jgi:hypothetical protein
MNQQEFITILKEKKYSYKTDSNTIIVDHYEHVDLDNLTMLPENIIFKNNGYVDLGALVGLPEKVKFENNGEVYLKSGIYKYGNYTHP